MKLIFFEFKDIQKKKLKKIYRLHQGVTMTGKRYITIKNRNRIIYRVELVEKDFIECLGIFEKRELESDQHVIIWCDLSDPLFYEKYFQLGKYVYLLRNEFFDDFSEFLKLNLTDTIKKQIARFVSHSFEDVVKLIVNNKSFNYLRTITENDNSNEKTLCRCPNKYKSPMIESRSEILERVAFKKFTDNPNNSFRCLIKKYTKNFNRSISGIKVFKELENNSQNVYSGDKNSPEFFPESDCHCNNRYVKNKVKQINHYAEYEECSFKEQSPNTPLILDFSIFNTNGSLMFAKNFFENKYNIVCGETSLYVELFTKIYQKNFKILYALKERLTKTDILYQKIKLKRMTQKISFKNPICNPGYIIERGRSREIKVCRETGSYQEVSGITRPFHYECDFVPYNDNFKPSKKSSLASFTLTYCKYYVFNVRKNLRKK